MEGVDRMFLHDAIELVQDIGAAVQPFTSETLIHGDLTFENILWDDGITALLDVEWSRPGPPDLDLDIILRCCAYPHLHVAERHVAATRAVHYADAPAWLEIGRAHVCTPVTNAHRACRLLRAKKKQ